MTTQRCLTDRLSTPEELESVEVIVLGLSRTGTMCTSNHFLEHCSEDLIPIHIFVSCWQFCLESSPYHIISDHLLAMYNALNRLGYKSYHMSEACLMTGKGHLIMWNEAIQAKYNPSSSVRSDGLSTPSPYTSANFRKLLQDYSAVTDAPTVLFAPELLEAYPRARLVLTRHPRGVDAWLRSMQNSYFRICNWNIWSILMRYDTNFSLPYITLLHCIVEVWTGTPWQVAKDFTAVEPRLRSFYEDHNHEMRRLAQSQGRELLEFYPAQGWEPLCRFLGKEVPSEPYPHYNEGDYVVALHKHAVVMRLRSTFGMPIATAVVSAAAAGFIWWSLRR